MASIATNQTILVVGGGISGMTAALEAAECGKQVILVEKTPVLGGRTARLYRYFPKMCHPTCGLEINLRRIKQNRNIRLMTMTEVTAVAGSRGNYSVTLKVTPRFVNENCTACGKCGEAVTTEVSNPWNYGLDKMKAAYLPHNMAHPQRYRDRSVHRRHARGRKGQGGLPGRRRRSRHEGRVRLAASRRRDLRHRLAPLRRGENPALRLRPLRQRHHQPRIRAPGRSAGPHRRQDPAPLDGKEAKNVAFIQCAGSRDENHLRHCSRICCMASLKQTQYVREAFGDAGKSTIYYIDIRAIDRFEDFYQMVQKDATVSFVKSKVAKIVENPENGNPVLHGVDTEGYHRYAIEHDLVVLAVGMEPEITGVKLPDDVILDSSNFIEGSKDGGMFGAGAASSPLDVNRAVQSATAASLHAIQVIRKTASTEAV
jgi:quinone-modifying oxidoreductase subunit QmoA